MADLQANRGEPRMLMPSSRKGRGRKRVVRRPVPIPASLAAKLRQAAGERPQTEPLLRKPDGAPRYGHSHERPFAKAAAKAGLAGVTAYWLRHSAIVRSLLAGVPIRAVAANSDTSVKMIERTYTRFIGDHSDEITRRALIDPAVRQ